MRSKPRDNVTDRCAIIFHRNINLSTSWLILGEDGSSNKGSSISLRAQDPTLSKAPSSAQSEASLTGDGEAEQDAADGNRSEGAPATPSPPLSPAASDISEPQSTLVNQTAQEPTWREVTVSGGE